MAEDRPFLGKGWSFPPTFYRDTKSVAMVADLDDICQSLMILLNTTLGERVMQPKYGANLQDMIFEPIDNSILAFLEDLIRTAIIYHEPRIQLLGVRINREAERLLEGTLEISISFVVRSTNSRFNIVFPFYIQEGVNIVGISP